MKMFGGNGSSTVIPAWEETEVAGVKWLERLTILASDGKTLL